MAIPERSRRLIGNVWQYVTASENGGGGGVSEVVADDASVTVTNGTGPVVGLSASGGSQPYMRTVQRTISWVDDPDSRVPGTGVTIATVAADECVVDVMIVLTENMTGTDAAAADGYITEPGIPDFTVYASNANPKHYESDPGGLGARTGAMKGYFARDDDPAVAVDLTGGVFVATLLILGGSA